MQSSAHMYCVQMETKFAGCNASYKHSFDKSEYKTHPATLSLYDNTMKTNNNTTNSLDSW